jgi:hypothetical protein
MLNARSLSEAEGNLIISKVFYSLLRLGCSFAEWLFRSILSAVLFAKFHHLLKLHLCFPYLKDKLTRL